MPDLIPPSNDAGSLELQTLNRLRNQGGAGQTFDELVTFLSAAEGDVRALLYDLAQRRRVRFSDGKWHLE